MAKYIFSTKYETFGFQCSYLMLITYRQMVLNWH